MHPSAPRLTKLLVHEGDHVKKGQLLVQLDDAKARSQAAQAQAQVLAAEADLGAVEKGGNREEVLTLESQIVKARTTCDTAQRNLDALQRLQQQGAASPGEITNAEDQLKRANCRSQSSSPEAKESLFPARDYPRRRARNRRRKPPTPPPKMCSIS